MADSFAYGFFRSSRSLHELHEGFDKARQIIRSPPNMVLVLEALGDRLPGNNPVQVETNRAISAGMNYLCEARLPSSDDSATTDYQTAIGLERLFLKVLGPHDQGVLYRNPDGRYQFLKEIPQD